MEREKEHGQLSIEDCVELRSESARQFIGQVPPALIRTGTAIVAATIAMLCVVVCSVHYPISIEAEGIVSSIDTLSVNIPYKYLYLFGEQRVINAEFEGETDHIRSYQVTSFSRDLRQIDGDNYFVAKVFLSADSSIVQIGQKAETRIIVSDKTIWQLIFR